MVSARRVEGRRLYDLAREGKEVEREARTVEVHAFDLVDFAPSDYPEATFRIRCSSGTYVRTLADDLARSLGGRAHLIALRRLRSGSLRVEQAHTLEALEAAAAEGRAAEALLDPAEGLADLPGGAGDHRDGGGGVPRGGVPGAARWGSPCRRRARTGCSTRRGACWRSTGSRGGRRARRWWWR